MNPRFLTQIFAAALLVCTSAGVHSQITTAQHTGFLQDYHRLGHVGGVQLEQVWIDPAFDVRAWRTLYVAPTRIDPQAYYRNPQLDHGIATQISQSLQAQLTGNLQQAGIFQFVSDDPFFSGKRAQALTLETRITEISSGISATGDNCRGGFTTIQIEGKVIENRTCRTLVEFADRRNHPGNFLCGGRTTPGESQYFLNLDSNGIMRGIVQLFIYLREMGPPANQR